MNSQEEFIPAFKIKRDEYLIEIRKNKSSDYILTKRAKLFSKIFNNEEDSKITLEQIDTSEITKLCEEFKFHYSQQNMESLVQVLEKIRMIVSHDTIKDPPLNELVHSGIVPELVYMLRPEVHHYEKVVFECSWILTGLAAGDSDHTEYLVNEKIIPYCLCLLEHRNFEIVDHAMWILANVTGENLKYRDEALALGIVNKLDTMLSSHGTIAPEHVIQITWLMSNLCRGHGKKHYPEYSEVLPFTSFIDNFLKSKQDVETYQHCMYALFYLTWSEDEDHQDESKIDEILDMDAMAQIVDLLSYVDNQTLLLPTLKLLTNITGGNDAQAQAVLNNNILDHMIPMLGHKEFKIRKQTCVMLSNLLSGTSFQIADVVNYENGSIIRKMIDMVRKDDKEIGEECLCGFANLSEKANFLEINLFVQNGAIELFVDLIRAKINPKITELSLETLEAILKEGDKMSMELGTLGNKFLLLFCSFSGMGLLEELQSNENLKIAEVSHSLLQDYAPYENQLE